MRAELNFPWERYALIVALARRVQDEGGALGKTALQKLVYFLQVVFGVDVGYEFSLYTYGPFAAELMHDLDVVEVMGGVRVDYDAEFNRYRISPGPKAAWIENRARAFIAKASPAIDQVARDHARSSARDLELYATIVFAQRGMAPGGGARRDEALIHEVHEIKPQFGEAEIGNAIRRLRELGYIDEARVH